MHLVLGWQWTMAALFGVLIAATDPVSVIATFKEAKVEGRLRLLVEAESLFNDSTAAVAFVIALTFAMGQTMSAETIAGTLILSIVGGIGSGLLVGWGCLFIAGRTRDHLVELALTTIAAFGSFWLAEHFHWSGVLATMTAGLLVGNTKALGFVTEKGEESIESFWEFAAFVVNSIVFIILGVNEAYQDLGRSAAAIGVAIIAVIIARAVAIYPLSLLFMRSRWKIESAHQHIMFWGGSARRARSRTRARNSRKRAVSSGNFNRHIRRGRLLGFRARFDDDTAFEQVGTIAERKTKSI